MAAADRPVMLSLVPFEPRHAWSICRWATAPDDLRWLAPSTPPPLTPLKVASWKREGGEALVLVARGCRAPLAYGELNPMRIRKSHYWLGHLVVRPDLRRRGIGAELLRLLSARAFLRLGAERLSLIVFPDNHSAIRCYRRAGFVRTGEERHCFGDPPAPYNLVRMELTREAWRRAQE